MPAMTYLLRHPKTSIYYFRRAVPPALRAALGKGEWKESLRTTDVRKAKALAHEVGLRVQAKFDQVQRELAGEAAYDTLTSADTEKLAAQWLAERVEADEEGRLRVKPGAASVDAVSLMYEQVLEAIDQFPKPTSLRPVARDMERICDEHVLRLEKSSESYKRLGRDLLHAHKQFYELIHARDTGQWPEVPGAPAQEFTKAPPRSARRNTIRSVYEAWATERKPAEKTLKEWNRAVRRWEELHGDTPVADISRIMVSAFKDALLQTPARPPHKMRELPLPEMIEAAKGKPDLARVSPQAVNKTLAGIKTVLSHAVRGGLIENNPATQVRALVPRKSVDEEIRSFTEEELKLVLEAAAREKRKSDRWLPLLAACTGARRNELALATVADIQRTPDGNIIYLRITDAGEGKSLKNVGSRRSVPLHPVLIASGFLEYVACLPKPGPLFPGLTPSAYTKRFGRMLDSLGLKERGTVFHSFRHTFIDLCREARVDEEIRDKLTGHSASGRIGRKYGNRELLDLLNDAVSRIVLPL